MLALHIPSYLLSLRVCSADQPLWALLCNLSLSQLQVERRILYVNVTATLGVELAPGATPDEVKAAMDLTSLSADDPIGLLSNDPDKFFGRTTKVSRMA